MTAPANQPPGASPGESLVLSGEAMIRVEMDHMTKVSLLHKRPSVGEITKRVVEDVEACPDLAETFLYVIEYEWQGKTVRQEGISVDGAYELLRAWGNAGTKCVVTGEDAANLYLMGIFVDFETNTRVERPFVVAKVQHRRDGSAVRLGEEKLTQAIMVGVSKAVRNAIVKALPRRLTFDFHAATIRVAAAAAERAQKEGDWIAKLLKAFGEFGIARERIEEKIGKKLEAMSAQEYAELRGVWQSIHDDHAALDIHFPTGEPADEGSASASVDDVLKSGAESSEDPPPVEKDQTTLDLSSYPSGQDTKATPTPKRRRAAADDDPPAAKRGGRELVCRHCKAKRSQHDDLDHLFEPQP